MAEGAKATPRPWKLRSNRNSTWMSPAERRRYAYVQIGKDDAYTTAQLEKADAALIVLAVNAHDALVAALRALVGMVKENGPDYADADQMIEAELLLRLLDDPEPQP